MKAQPEILPYETKLNHYRIKPAFYETDAQEAAHRAEAAQLNRRIIAVAAVLMTEMWALTAGIEAWAEGHSTTLAWILGFQLASFLVALTVSKVAAAPRVPAIAVIQMTTSEPAIAD